MFENILEKFNIKNKETYTLEDLRNLLDASISIANGLFEEIFNIEFSEDVKKLVDSDRMGLKEYWWYHEPIRRDIHEEKKATLEKKKIDDKLVFSLQISNHYLIDFDSPFINDLENPNSHIIYVVGILKEFYNIANNIETISLSNKEITDKVGHIFSFSLYHTMTWDSKSKMLLLDEEVFQFYDDLELLKSSRAGNLIIDPKYNPNIYALKEFVLKYRPLYYGKKLVADKKLDINGKAKVKNSFFYKNDDDILMRPEFYKNNLLQYYDLSDIDFTKKNLSHLDFSHNPEARINFSSIYHDLINANFEGFALQKETLRNLNLHETNLKGTGATIDLATCSISSPTKLGDGTQFDEDNKFMFFNKKLTQEETENLGIKIYRKEI